mgnify:FL=1
MKKTRVMIVDDSRVARELFELYLKGNDNYKVVCVEESASFADTFSKSAAIDVIIMDILMNDGSNGLDAAAKIKKMRPDIKIISVTSMAENSWIKRAKEIGIESFWFKEVSKETILDVIDRTVAGEHVYPESAPKVNVHLAASEEFTEGELKVLRLMTKGISNSEIAKKLNISEGTVKTHIHNMLVKTGCANRTTLAIEARISGLAVNLD